MTTPIHAGTPVAEIDVTQDLVRALLRAQQPHVADLPLEHVASGWDNEMFRLGEDLAVRLPRRALGDSLIVHEQTWLPVLASDLLPSIQVAIPVPKHAGVPGEGYPWCWSVVPWIDGDPVDVAPLNADQGKVLAGFLAALHKPAPVDAPVNPYRGVPLAPRRDGMEERMSRLSAQTDLITSPIIDLWQHALSVEVDVPKTWLHGDMHQRNVLASASGAITGVIDWGDICAGDRASDLASLWMLLADPDARADMMTHYDATPETWQRAAGWAVMYGIILLDAGRIDSPHQANMGAAILKRLADDTG
jgi:aminoglycoside phosphotransferase (APT) family kinase protein